MAMVKSNKQEQEWKAAQDINVSVDLISATKQHLKFLAAVDRNSSWLCQDGPALQRAIIRYTSCWMPLLAKHTESPLFEGKLVVPLDCEWIWHCHRLNPIRYKSDCQAFCGKILDNKNVLSSTQGDVGKEMEDLWNKLYPNESFVLDASVVENNNNENNLTKAADFTNYDLTSAVQRQSSFFSQVSELHMSNERYLEGAVARYKGFLHLAKRNIEMDMHNFLAPTYDIDLIWHTHQLHPISYFIDLKSILGAIMGHDDTVGDRTKGQKLDTGFTRTINSWTDTYGSRYRRAGAMHKFMEKEIISLDEEQKVINIPDLEIMEVMLELVDVKDMPEEHTGKRLFVLYSKTQPDVLFMDKRSLPMLSKFDDQAASFKCQPTGKLLFELVACLPSDEVSHPIQTLGSCSISLDDFLLPESGLMVEKCLELMPSTGCETIKPISLRLAISVTPPTPTPVLLKVANSCGIPSDSATASNGGSCIANCVVISKENASDASTCPASNGGSCIANCVVLSKENASDAKTFSKLSATASNASFCITVCVGIPKDIPCDAKTCSKPSATASNGGSCIANCVVISKENACSKPNATASNGGSCIANCVVISKENACSKPSATASNGGSCIANCVVISKDNACFKLIGNASSGSKCMSTCVMMSSSKLNGTASSGSKCMSTCVLMSSSKLNGTASSGSKCMSTCVMMSSSKLNGAASSGSKCMSTCVMMSSDKPNATASAGSKCMSTCVMMSSDKPNATASSGSKCMSTCVMMSSENTCDANACVLVPGANVIPCA